MIPSPFMPAVFMQVLYALLVIIWQLVGVWFKASGEVPLGPVASLALAGQAIVLAVLFIVVLRYSPHWYLLLSVLSAVPATVSIHYSLTADPAFWYSDFARYVGVTINGVGLVAVLLAVLAYTRWLRARPAAESADSG